MRAVAYRGAGEFIPFYALYALLFADHGLNTAQISALLAVWSLTAFVLEVPSGAWADLVSRRLLLVMAGVLTAVGFACWSIFPGFIGFAAGFLLWGVGGALQSGTFEALLYDELDARGAAGDYARILGYATAAAELSALLAILAAAPLFDWGGYALVGWSSVAAALVQVALASTLPAAPKVAEPLTARRTPLAGYLAMLRSGVGEAMRHGVVRRGVLLAALLYGLTAIDEYFGLLAHDAGAATGTVPLLVGLTVAGSLIGSTLAARTSGMRARAMAAALIVAGLALAVGALIGGPGLFGAAGFAAIGVGYGIVMNATVVTEARLQDAITGPARATVTSAAGLLSELVSLAIFAAVAVLTAVLPISATLALLATPVLLSGFLALRWLPRARAIVAEDGTTRATEDRLPG
ncbi:MFS transporter [Aldersonia sp. NBC_00410]|uniref:MFS transporter n=1 Tax=Aldersonia sp. NBC_00410 TaxID=2975954 RepID=UPI00224DA2E0|nr:MFS transporter [Aldersonia sp. NBC_00410]MCX5042283.1 MFS transporter [Aldersonia sp. NBC_00410]